MTHPRVHGGHDRRHWLRRAGSLVATVLLVGSAVACDPVTPPPVGPAALVSGNPVDNTPWVLDGQVWSIAQVGNRVVVGGEFTQVSDAGSTTVIPVSNVFAYDPVTGHVDTAFHPTTDGRVNTVIAAADGQSVYLGGAFKNIGSTLTGGLARVRLTDGALVPGFSANTDGWVYDVVLRGTKVYIGGTFTKVRNVSRGGVAAVDSTTGAVDPNLNIAFTNTVAATGTGSSPTPYVYRIDVSPDSSKMVVVGNFLKAGGQSRAQLAVLDLATTPATVSTWQSDVPAINLKYFFMRDVAISPDGTYFVTTAWFHAGNPLYDATTRWDLTTTTPHQEPQWIDATGGDSVFSVALTGQVVYIGGHPRWMNNGNTPAKDTAGPAAVPRNQVAALDPVNGLPFSWNPGQDRGFGATALTVTSDGLFIGSDTSNIAGEYHPRLSFFPLSGGTPLVAPRPATLPTTLYTASNDGVLRARSFDGVNAPGLATTVTGGPDWTKVRGSFMLNGLVYTATSDGRLVAQEFNGTTWGATYTQPSWIGFSAAQSMFYDHGRIYFTAVNDSNLYYRYFEPQTGIVGADLFVASTHADGFSWSSVLGATMVGGALYLGHNDAALYKVSWADGKPVVGSMTRIESPVFPGYFWRTPAMFAFSA